MTLNLVKSLHDAGKPEATMIEELKALASELRVRVRLADVSAKAEHSLGAYLAENRHAILSALSAAEKLEVMKEALERIALNDDLLEAQITATAALAALEGK